MNVGDKQYVVQQDREYSRYDQQFIDVFKVQLIEAKVAEERTTVATCLRDSDALGIVKALNETHGY